MEFVGVLIKWLPLLLLLHFPRVVPAVPWEQHRPSHLPLMAGNQTTLIKTAVPPPADQAVDSFTFISPKHINGNPNTSNRAPAAEYFTNPQRLQPLNSPSMYINGNPHLETVNGHEDIPNGVDNKNVVETQHATCHINTDQLVATAEATVTKVLTDFCNLHVMENRFTALEEALEKAVVELKDSIYNLEGRIKDHKDVLSNGQLRLSESVEKKCKMPVEEKQSGLKSSDESYRVGAIPNPHNQKDSKVKTLQSNDLDKDNELVIGTSSRDPEILKFNSTIHLEPSIAGQKKVFTYYWKLLSIQKKLREWDPHWSIRSPNFNIYPAGYRMYLRIYPRQDEEKFFIHVGLTKGDFDQDLKWPFALKLRVSVLDQAQELRVQEDITSRVWDPTQLCSEFNWQKPTQGDNSECVGLGFPHEVLRQRNYISNDNVIIKLTVYLV